MRLAFLVSAIIFSSTLYVSTEILGALHRIQYPWVVLTWTIAVTILFICGRKYLSLKPWSTAIGQLVSFSLLEKILFLAISAVLFIKGMSAVLSAPNTSDALAYHLPRVEHWIQNQSLEGYPTSVLRQLYSPPFAEYVIMHLRILSGADYLSNAVQWFAAALSAGAVSLLAQLMGASRLGQCVAALLTLTLPMALVQATSTQNDFVLTAWLTVFAYCLWRTYLKPKPKWFVLTGFALGLACVTKGNAYIFAPAGLIVFLAAALWQRAWKKIAVLFLVLGLAVVMVLPYAGHNMRNFGSPYWMHIKLTNEEISFKTLIDNIKADAGLHLISPSKLSQGEDDSPNTYYLLLFLVSLALLVHPRARKPAVLIFAAGILLMLILFCGIIVHSPFNSRFHLAFFVMTTPFTATLLDFVLGRLGAVVALGLMALSVPWLINCNEHSFIGPRSILRLSRQEQYFSTVPLIKLPYEIIKQGLVQQNCRQIGLVGGENYIEYPLWAMFNFDSKIRIEYVEPYNKTSQFPYPKGDFAPCALITERDERDSILLPQGYFIRVWYARIPQQKQIIALFVRKF